MGISKWVVIAVVIVVVVAGDASAASPKDYLSCLGECMGRKPIDLPTFTWPPHCGVYCASLNNDPLSSAATVDRFCDLGCITSQFNTLSNSASDGNEAAMNGCVSTCAGICRSPNPIPSKLGHNVEMNVQEATAANLNNRFACMEDCQENSPWYMPAAGWPLYCEAYCATQTTDHTLSSAAVDRFCDLGCITLECPILSSIPGDEAAFKGCVSTCTDMERDIEHHTEDASEATHNPNASISEGASVAPEPVKKKKILKCNYNGEAIGEGSGSASSTLGLLTRTHVPISCKEWKKADGGKKDHVWTKMKELFNFTDAQRDNQMKKVGLAWKKYKNKLRCKYLKGDNFKNWIAAKPEKISAEDWYEFCVQENTPEQKQLREKNKKIRRKPR